jgi:hypothetical protein
MKLSDRSIFGLYLAAVTLLTCAFFGRFTGNFFAYDDFGLLELAAKGPGAIMLGYNYTLRFVNNVVWIPLHFLSGNNPLGYNLFSMVLWPLNAVLLYRFLQRLLGSSALAALAGLIFCASAVGSDAVFWRAASGTLLNTTFYLLTLHAYTIFRQTGAPGKWRLSVLCFILAMFSKEEAASLPLVIILLELLYFNGAADLKGVARRVSVFGSIIVASVALNYLVIYRLLQVQSELAHVFKLRPLHSLFSGWTVFFLRPEGSFAWSDPGIYLAAAVLLPGLFLVRDRRLLLFGLGWVFLSFLPQSLSGMSQFQPNDVISLSLSRHLYLPSAGAAICYTALLAGIAERFPARVAVSAGVFFLLFFVLVNYQRVAARGSQWAAIGDPMQRFLAKMKKVQPQLPPRAQVFVVNTPTGRAFIQQGLRVFYQNPTITYILNPQNFLPDPGKPAFLITCHALADGDMRVQLEPIE